MHRRTLLAGSAATVLSACGFRPRGAPEFAFRSLYLGAPQASPLARELQRSGKKYGISSACVGGGQGMALLIENTSV